MKRVQKIADEFFRKQGIESLPVEYPALIEIIRKNGWEIMTYSEAEPVIRQLKLEKYRYTCPGFTYQSQDGALIFIQDELGYLEKIKVICHELGHIVLLHTSYGILGKSESPETENIQEEEADIFALEFQAPGFMLYREHLTCAQKIVDAGILSPEDARKQYQSYLEYVRSHRTESFVKQLCTYLAVAAVSFSAAVGGVCLYRAAENALPASRPEPTPQTETAAPAQRLPKTQTPAPAEQPAETTPAGRQTEMVYVTPSGKKYHRPDCRHVAGRDTTVLTEQDALELGYTPCKDCRPEN